MAKSFDIRSPLRHPRAVSNQSQSDAAPRTSVVIVSWNRLADLARAIASLRAQQGPPPEIIVVDNGSTDGTADHLRSGACGPLTLAAAPRNLGASVARNIGIRLARGEFVAFMDSDAVALDFSLLALLVARLESDATLAAVAPAIYRDPERRETWLMGGYFLRGYYHDHPRSLTEWRNPDMVSTCFSLWRADLLRRIGGFNPAYPYCFEDCELSIRARDTGLALAIEPTVGVWHNLSSDGRVRSDASWEHYHYIARAVNRFQLVRLGLVGFLREFAWRQTAAGRALHRFVYVQAPLGRLQHAWIRWGVPVATLLNWRDIRAQERRRNWVENAPMHEVRVESVTGAPK